MYYIYLMFPNFLEAGERSKLRLCKSKCGKTSLHQVCKYKHIILYVAQEFWTNTGIIQKLLIITMMNVFSPKFLSVSDDK